MPSRTAGVYQVIECSKVGQACNVPHCPRLATPPHGSRMPHTGFHAAQQAASSPAPRLADAERDVLKRPTGTYALGAVVHPARRRAPTPGTPAGA